MPHGVLKSLALEGYRSGALSDGQLRRLLDVETRFEVHGFLKDHGMSLNYSMEELEQDRETVKRLGIVEGLVIADSSPIHDLFLIGDIDTLSSLYERIIVPEMVIAALRHQRTPEAVRDWIEARPDWLDVRQPHLAASGPLAELDDGERDAILFAMELEADLLLLDDRKARVEAARQNRTTMGTLGGLEAASLRDLLDLPEAISCLLETNFRVDQTLIDDLLARGAKRK